MSDELQKNERVAEAVSCLNRAQELLEVEGLFDRLEKICAWSPRCYVERVERELADARVSVTVHTALTADALQRVDLRTLDFERIKKGRDLALEAIEYIAYAGLSSRHMVDYAIEFLKRNKSSVSFPRDRYEKLCEAIAEIETLRRERNQAQKWEDSAMHVAGMYCKGMEYYRGLVEQIGQTIGESAYIQDDGGKVDSVLCAKVPELVEELKQGLAEAREENKKLREALLRVRTWGISSKNFSATDSYKMAEWIDDACAGELPEPDGPWIYEKMEETK